MQRLALVSRFFILTLAFAAPALASDIETPLGYITKSSFEASAGKSFGGQVKLLDGGSLPSPSCSLSFGRAPATRDYTILFSVTRHNQTLKALCRSKIRVNVCGVPNQELSGLQSIPLTGCSVVSGGVPGSIFSADTSLNVNYISTDEEMTIRYGQPQSAAVSNGKVKPQVATPPSDKSEDRVSIGRL